MNFLAEGAREGGRTLRKDVFLPSKHRLSAFYKTLPSKNPSKNLVFTENPSQAPSKNPSKKHLLLENLLRTLLRSVRLHDPLCVHPIAGHGEICHPHGWSTWRPADHKGPKKSFNSKLGGRFGYSLFFSAREGEGSPRPLGGRGGGRFFIENLRGGGVSTRGRVVGRMSAANWGFFWGGGG